MLQPAVQVKRILFEEQGDNSGIKDRVTVARWVARSSWSLPCRSIRIGNYKVLPKEKLAVTPLGIQFEVPAILDHQELLTITISMNHILKVLAHFGKSMPILFLHVSEEACARVRRQLKMLNSRAFYLDFQSLDETQKRITILPEKLTEENKAVLKQLLGTKLQELDLRDANEILLRNCPRDVAKLKAKMDLTWAPGNQGTCTSVIPASPWLFLTPTKKDEGST